MNEQDRLAKLTGQHVEFKGGRDEERAFAVVRLHEAAREYIAARHACYEIGIAVDVELNGHGYDL